MSDYNGQDMRGSDAGQLSAIAMTAMVASVGNADSQARTESTVSDAVGSYPVDSSSVQNTEQGRQSCGGSR